MKVLQADLWKYTNCVFVTKIGESPVRVILKEVDSKNAHISNYHHRATVMKMKLSSFLKQFTLVE